MQNNPLNGHMSAKEIIGAASATSSLQLASLQDPMSSSFLARDDNATVGESIEKFLKFLLQIDSTFRVSHYFGANRGTVVAISPDGTTVLNMEFASGKSYLSSPNGEDSPAIAGSGNLSSGVIISGVIRAPAFKFTVLTSLLPDCFTRQVDIENRTLHLTNVFVAGSGDAEYLESRRNSFDSTSTEWVYDYLYPDVRMNDLVEAYLSSREAILILLGAPGTGKTTLLRKILADIRPGVGSRCSIVYIKDTKVVKFSEFWADMEGLRPDAIVFDDFNMSTCGSVEEGDRNEFVNQLLSFTNGVFDKRTKVIITTNLEVTSIDKATIRPGRCFDVIKLRPLTRAEALNVWVQNFELNQETFEAEFGDAEHISSAWLISAKETVLSRRNRRYLVDQSASVRNVLM